MLRALQDLFVPLLRERGFRGSLPHFRRVRDGRVDLLTVQFDKFGGSFIVELGRAPATPYHTSSGEEIPPDRLRALDLDLRDRARLHAGGPARELWFSFGRSLWWWRNAGRFERAAQRVASLLPQADAWLAGHEEQQSVRPYDGA